MFIEENKEHGKVIFMHSECCNAHWDIVLKEDGTGFLQCEKCGAHVKTDIISLIHSISITKCGCDLCSDEDT